MIDALATTVTVVMLVMAVWTALLTILNRPVGRVVLGVLAAVEVLLVAQTAVAVVLLLMGERPVGPTPEFLGYHFTTVLVLPAAVIWAMGDRSRWGTGVLTIGCLSAAAMTVRMTQIWSGFGGVGGG